MPNRHTTQVVLMNSDIAECMSGHTVDREETCTTLKAICKCIMCKNVMHMPVKEKCGHSFTCMACQKQHHATSKAGLQCPMCQRHSYKKKQLTVNKTLHIFIKSFFEDNEEKKYMKECQNLLKCVLCHRVMCQPLFETCGHSFMCKGCYVSHKKTSLVRGTRMGQASTNHISCPHCGQQTRHKGKVQLKTAIDETLHQCSIVAFPNEFPSHREGLHEQNSEIENCALFQRIEKTSNIVKKAEYKANVTKLIHSVERDKWLMCNCKPAEYGPFPVIPYTSQNFNIVACCPRYNKKQNRTGCKFFKKLSESELERFIQLIKIR